MRVIGRTEGSAATRPTAHFGHYRARDGSRGEQVGLDLDSPHVALVVGKRGSGKSYTLGVLAEEIARTEGVAPVVADPMGVFGTLTESVGGDDPVPARVVRPRLPADALDPRGWCTVLDLDPAEDTGTLVWQAAAQAGTLAGMRAFVADATVDEATRRAARNHLRLADSWCVFGDGETGGDGESVSGSLFEAGVTVLDLAGLDRGPMNAVLAGVAQQLYDTRVTAETDRLPWLLVDEAHAFFGGVADGPLQTILTRGRQPGVSLVAATQRPSALPAVAISQSDLLVTHRLTSTADREALSAARPSYVTTTLGERMPTDPGEALVVDDATESVHSVQVRERETPHGGESPAVSSM